MRLRECIDHLEKIAREHGGDLDVRVVAYDRCDDIRLDAVDRVVFSASHPGLVVLESTVVYGEPVNTWPHRGSAIEFAETGVGPLVGMTVLQLRMVLGTMLTYGDPPVYYDDNEGERRVGRADERPADGNLPYRILLS